MTDLLDRMTINQPRASSRRSVPSSPKIISEVHDINQINWVNGLTDPGEMLECGYLPEARRFANENDETYAKRLLSTLPKDLIEKIRNAAISRAGLDTSTGLVALMVAGKLPWHRLGVLVDKATTSEEAIALASLDWNVIKEQLTYKFNGETKTATGTFGLIREDTGAFLGKTGRVYKVIQNRHAFNFLDSLLANYGAKYVSAGAVYGGEQVFMCCEFPQQAFAINKVDEVFPFITFFNPHDGVSGSGYCYPGETQAVCANTLRTSLKGKKKGIALPHTGDIDNRIEDAKAAFGLSIQSFKEFREKAEFLATKKQEFLPYANNILDIICDVTMADVHKGTSGLLEKMTDKSEAERQFAVKAFEKNVERRKDILDDMIERHEMERNGVGGKRGTAWGNFSVMTDFSNHSTIGRQRGSEQDRTSRRFESIISGEADDFNQVALERALAI